MQLWVPPHQVLLRDHLCDLLGETGHRFLYVLTVWFHVYSDLLQRQLEICLQV